MIQLILHIDSTDYNFKLWKISYITFNNPPPKKKKRKKKEFLVYLPYIFPHNETLNQPTLKKIYIYSGW